MKTLSTLLSGIVAVPQCGAVSPDDLHLLALLDPLRRVAVTVRGHVFTLTALDARDYASVVGAPPLLRLPDSDPALRGDFGSVSVAGLRQVPDAEECRYGGLLACGIVCAFWAVVLVVFVFAVR